MSRPDRIPSTDEVVAAYEALSAGARDKPDTPLLSLLLELHANNVAQWRREDAARSGDGDDSAVAAAKRDIDQLNSHRHRLLESVDAAVAGFLPNNPTAPPSTETPAMVYDRLSVLVTRISFTEQAAAEHAEGDFAARVPILHDQLAVLSEAITVLLDELRTGRKRFVPYESLKLYGSPVSPS